MRHTDTIIRIVIAEDHTLVRQGMLLVLSQDHRFKIVAEASDGKTAWQYTRELRPDVLILDLGLPELDGLDVMQLLSTHGLKTRVLVVTARQDPRAVRAALARGAHGYLLKSHDADALIEGVHVVAGGGGYVSRELAALASLGAASTVLTPREVEIARSVGRGLSSKQIGTQLGISEHTVRKHRENIARKLDLRNAAELVAWAIHHYL